MNILINIINEEDIRYINEYNGDRDKLLQNAISIGLKSITMSHVEMNGCSYYNPLKEYIDKKYSEHKLSLDQISTSFDELMNIKQNSSKKGKLGEHLAIRTLKQKYPNFEIEDRTGIGHEGDCYVYSDEYGKILFEFKTYTNSINKDEVNKFKRDVDSTNSSYGILISHTSGIVGKKRIDIEVHNKKILLYVSNSGLNGFGIEMAMELLITLINADYINKDINILNYPSELDSLYSMLSELYEVINNFSRISSQIIDSKLKIDTVLDSLYRQCITYETNGSDIIKKIQSELDYLPNNKLYKSIALDIDKLTNTISCKSNRELLKKLYNTFIYKEINISLAEGTDMIIMEKGKQYIGKVLIKSKIEVLFVINDLSNISINGTYEKIKGNHICIQLGKQIDIWNIVNSRLN